MTLKSLLPVLGLIALSAPTFAQDSVVVAPAAAAAAPVVADEAWMAKKIDLEMKDVTPIEAIKKVLEAAGITDYKIAGGVESGGVNLKLSLAFVQTPVGDALRAACRLAGAAYIPSTRDGKPSVQIVKRGDSAARVLNLAPRVARGGDANVLTMPAPFRTFTTRGAALPEKRVSLDVRRKSVRDTLKDLMKQAGLDFVIEDGIADDLKKSFTFENVPIGTALDAICQSAEVGWSVEQRGDKPLVRIGKSVRNSPFNRLGILSGESEGLAGLTEIPGLDAGAMAGLTTTLESLPAMLEGLSHLEMPEGVEMPAEVRLEIQKAMKESRKEIERAMKEQRGAMAEARRSLDKARAEQRRAEEKGKSKTKPSRSNDKSERPPFEP